jgi:hypothetical protein
VHLKYTNNRHFSRLHISILLPLDVICITTNRVVIGVCFATFVQNGGNRGTVTFSVARGVTYSNPFFKSVAIG